MKVSFKKFLSIIALSFGLITTSACEQQMIDYTGQVKFSQADWKESDFMSSGLGVVTLKNSIDGDTAHFYSGPYNKIVQGRFNGVDTPESTGIIEEWGKAAANFTKEILTKAQTIVLETERKDGIEGPEADSTGGRYLVWVWYQPEANADYRLLSKKALEKLRKKSYSKYPSRLKSLYVSKDLKDAEMWANSFIKKVSKNFLKFENSY